jgi:glycosyltransferase involved in cell wall biosynthesis
LNIPRSIKKILICNSSIFISGAEKSLFDFIQNAGSNGFEAIYTNSNKNKPNAELLSTFIHVPYMWFTITKNPFKILGYFCSLIISLAKLYQITLKYNIKVIYANTSKCAIYRILLKLLTNRKLICHIRDNINSQLLLNIILKNSDRIISISQHIYNQFPSGLTKNYLVFGGINPDDWKINTCLQDKKNNNCNSITIVCIGQLTKWKNQIDFVKAVKIIEDKYPKTSFLIIGDDLSGREKKYKKKLFSLVEELELQNNVQFIGYRNDIKNLINNIDILIHPAIDEPFGRVLIEAMALEKPVVAYNCGGSAEIILDGETGFLVEPHNFEQLAAKTRQLIDDKELCIRMGKAGRQRVVEKFNTERYVPEMEEVFESI